ncbi:hypothetical protein ABEB36_001993 [Hypothenemus hampei]|uniref:Cell growth-regulating nucleolar protein n=1 Tax=Hypothenemus hampei TaxID=57062 RepID=A0ABD1FJW1_HYPHA
MVVFTCNHCGETLHKPKVEKHYQFQCRNYKSVTCVDCFKDFRNEEYVVHTKCITEDERYAAKGTFKNGIVKKGEVKQESWLETIKSICDVEKDLKPSIRRLLQTISEYSNVPRKKAKFMNFINSSSGNKVNMQEVEEAWNIIEKFKNSQQNNSKINNNKRPNDDEATSAAAAKKLKITGPTEPPQVTKIEEKKFSFKEKIAEILNEKQSISLKKLQKKIVKAYVRETGENNCEEKVVKKFTKKLKKIPNVTIEDDKVCVV